MKKHSILECLLVNLYLLLQFYNSISYTFGVKERKFKKLTCLFEKYKHIWNKSGFLHTTPSCITLENNGNIQQKCTVPTLYVKNVTKEPTNALVCVRCATVHKEYKNNRSYNILLYHTHTVHMNSCRTSTEGEMTNFSTPEIFRVNFRLFCAKPSLVLSMSSSLCIRNYWTT